MKNAKLFVLVVTVFSILVLCGCYDSHEIDETAYIIALGIDPSEPEGYTYTFQLANPLEMVSGEEDSSGKSTDASVRNFVIKAPDFYIAKNQLNNYLSKTADMSHLKLIVFSKYLENSGFLQHSQFLMHEREVRPHTNAAVANETAEEFIKSVKPTLEANTAKYYELMGLRSDSLYSPSITISAFLDKISAKDKSAVLPLAHAKPKSAEEQNPDSSSWISSGNAQIDSENAVLQGMAIFKDGKICGFSDSDSALIFNILSAKIKDCTVTLKNPADPKSSLVFRLSLPKTAKYSIENTNNRYKITAIQKANLKFAGDFMPKGFSSEDELYNFARQAISQKITAFVYDISRTKAADILDIGGYLGPQLDKFENWQNIFETAEYTVEFTS